jgi:hypothetical protein
MRDDERPQKTGDEELDRHLDDLAEDLRAPHSDKEERRRHQEAAQRAGGNARREGQGIHEGTH